MGLESMCLCTGTWFQPRDFRTSRHMVCSRELSSSSSYPRTAARKSTFSISAFSIQYLKLTELMNIPTAQTEEVLPPPNRNSVPQMQIRYPWATLTSTSCCHRGYKLSLCDSRDQVWGRYSPDTWNGAENHEEETRVTPTWQAQSPQERSSSWGWKLRG